MDSSRKTQLVPEASPCVVQQATGAQVVDVGAVEEQSLNAMLRTTADGEADQVEQERPPVLTGAKLP